MKSLLGQYCCPRIAASLRAVTLTSPVRSAHGVSISLYSLDISILSLSIFSRPLTTEILMSTASTAGWVQPNYVNPQEQSWLPVFLAIAVGTATVIAWIRLGLRARKLVGGGLGWDDVSATHALP